MARPSKHEVRYRHVGRPNKIDEIVLRKLEDAFSNGLTDALACLYANIGETTLYEYCQRNPAFAKRKEELKRTPDLRAMTTLANDTANVGGARYWAERRIKEFTPTQEIKHSGEVAIKNVTDPKILEAMKAYDAKRAEQIRDEARAME